MPLIAGAAENDDDEAADLEDAIKASLKISSRTSTPVAGPSGSRSKSVKETLKSRASMAALRALAAEKRAQGGVKVVDDRGAWDSDGSLSEAEAIDSDALDSDAEASTSKVKTKSKKTKVKAKINVANTTNPKHMTLLELKAMRKAAELERKIANAPVHKLERAMKAQLGRRLTPVCFIDYYVEPKAAVDAGLLTFFWCRRRKRQSHSTTIIQSFVLCGVTLKLTYRSEHQRKPRNLLVSRRSYYLSSRLVLTFYLSFN